MALVKCKECGCDISATAKTCPKCGANRVKSKAWVLLIPVGLLVFFFAFGSIKNASRSHEQNKNLDAIRYCVDQPEYKQGNAIAVGACTLMKSEYIKKWGSYP